ncbi:MAG TPA: DUF2723 domain-containing protein, partial [Gemmatimonadales bacterium]|nr:DUF2723 domain-containing protein [Gemmatimonadales bacterium]
MTEPRESPPYRSAALVSGFVLLGYLLTLAPSVTWWDAGEFIAAARTLGIPHPPGTPLYVMVAHLWGALVPVGEYAARLNFLSALFSALGAGGFFLIAHEALGAAEAFRDVPLLRLGGAAAAAVAGAFTFTQWQNSNETEVYAVAVFTIALMAWLALVWRRDRRNGEPAARWLLLILYLGGLSIGCHLLALLAGPAIVVLVWATLREAPAESEEGRRAEWGMLAVFAATWLLMVGIGLGSRLILSFSVVALLLAFFLAIRGRVAGFGVIGLALVAVGVTTYAFLYIRAGQHPPLNEAQPDHWDALLAVIRRAQYPPRTPFDDPTVLHGPDNPGRTLLIFGYQLLSYLEYFDWQWANALQAHIRLGSGALFLRTLVTVAFFSLGIQGFRLQRRTDRGAWWLCTTLFLTTGLGLVVYMNFKLADMGYDRFPSADQHEVRARDYFFVVSFVVWGLWAGLGLTELARRVRERMTGGASAAAGLILAFGLLPFMLNFAAATRRQIPDARLPGDYAYNLLNSVPPYGVIFTYGDNDTFPLWWAQEVEGVRRDVTVVCLALAQTSWYMRQMRDRVPGEFDEGSAPVYWRNRHAVRPTAPLTTMTNADIGAAGRAVRLGDSLAVMIGPVRVSYPPGTVFFPHDVFVLRVLQDNLGRRPVAWSVAAAENV